MRAPLPLAALTAVALLSAACGSTVPGAGDLSAGGTDSSGLGGPLGTAPSSAPGGSGPAGGPGTGGGATGGSSGVLGAGAAGSSSTTGTSGSATGGGTSGGTTSRGSLANGPGVTATEIRIGLLYDRNAGAINKATGAGGLSTGDPKADNAAVIDDINKHGGVAGRKLVPVYATIDSQSAQTVDEQYAAVCETFTKDQPVFAVQGPGPLSYLDCMKKAGLPVLGDDLPAFGAAEFAQHPNYIEQGYPNLDRLAAFHVGPLVAERYFTPWNTATGTAAASGPVKVGILTFESQIFTHAVNTFLVPSLRKLGYDPVVERIQDAQTAGDIGGEAAAIKSAELTFASRGVTHVLIFEEKAGVTELFLQAARSQNDYPRYGVNSANGPQALLTAGLMTARQAHGAVGYGWLPGLDLLPAQNPDNGKYATPQRRHCAAVMRSHNITFDSSNAQGIGYIACSELYLLKAALDRTPSHITLQTFLDAVASLGSSYQPAGGLGPVGQTFAPGRNDPQDSAYLMSYDDPLGCFVYSGSRQRIP